MPDTNKNKQQLLSNLSVFAFAALFIQLPFYQRFIPITIGVWILLSILNAVVNKIRPRFNLSLVLSIFLYGLIALSGFWSENKTVYQFDLEVKMSLAIIPLIFVFTNYSTKQIRTLVFAVIFGLISCYFFLTGKAILNTLKTGQVSNMFYVNLSTILHPSYLSYYANLGLLILILDYIKPTLSLFQKKWPYLILIGLLFIFSTLLLSKNGLFTSGVLILILISYWLVKKKFIVVFLILGSMAGTFVLAFTSSEMVKNRFTELVAGIDQTEHDSKEIYSTGIRIKVWEIAYEASIKNPFLGYGAGDTKDVLVEEYDKVGFSEALIRRLNAHNQFLQITLSNGIIGLTILASILLTPMFSWKRLNWFAISFGITTAIFFTTESVLETQAGVLGFTLFLCLLNHDTFRKSDSIS